MILPILGPGAHLHHDRCAELLFGHACLNSGEAVGGCVATHSASPPSFILGLNRVSLSTSVTTGRHSSAGAKPLQQSLRLVPEASSQSISLSQHIFILECLMSREAMLPQLHVHRETVQ